MARVTLALLTCLCFVFPAPAAVSSSNGRPDLGRNLPPSANRLLSRVLPQAASATPQADEYEVTENTEITLDGRPCKYRDVPANASIIKMEVSRDHVALKIHFRTRR